MTAPGAATALAVAALVVAAGAGGTAGGRGTVEGSVLVNPLAVSFALASQNVKTGQQIAAAAAVQNTGTRPLVSLSATLRVPVGVAIRDAATKVRTTLASGSAWAVLWRICAQRPGNYVLVAAVTATDGLGHTFALESRGVVLSASGKDARC
jgi:hypothetical protein